MKKFIKHYSKLCSEFGSEVVKQRFENLEAFRQACLQHRFYKPVYKNGEVGLIDHYRTDFEKVRMEYFGELIK